MAFSSSKENIMDKITVDCWKNVSAGQTVPSGFSYDLTAPAGEGTYTLYELVDTDSNTHQGWHWEKD
jgi:hypothetical protein